MKFSSINIESIYQFIDCDPLWNDFRDYLKSNSEEFLSKRFELENYKTDLPIGGFTESIVINLISSAIYEIGKSYIIEILNNLKSPIDRKKYTEGFPPKIMSPGFPGDVKLNFVFKDNKNIAIIIPFPIDTYNYIDKIDFEMINTQFLYGNTATLVFDEKNSKYFKGINYDSFA